MLNTTEHQKGGDLTQAALRKPRDLGNPQKPVEAQMNSSQAIRTGVDMCLIKASGDNDKCQTFKGRLDENHHHRSPAQNSDRVLG